MLLCFRAYYRTVFSMCFGTMVMIYTLLFSILSFDPALWLGKYEKISNLKLAAELASALYLCCCAVASDFLDKLCCFVCGGYYCISMSILSCCPDILFMTVGKRFRIRGQVFLFFHLGKIYIYLVYISNIYYIFYISIIYT